MKFDTLTKEDVRKIAERTFRSELDEVLDDMRRAAAENGLGGTAYNPTGAAAYFLHAVRWALQILEQQKAKK